MQICVIVCKSECNKKRDPTRKEREKGRPPDHPLPTQIGSNHSVKSKGASGCRRKPIDDLNSPQMKR